MVVESGVNIGSHIVQVVKSTYSSLSFSKGETVDFSVPDPHGGEMDIPDPVSVVLF